MSHPLRCALLLLGILLPTLSAEEQVDSCPPFGRILLTRPADTVTSVTLLITDGGSDRTAERIAGMHSLVASVDGNAYLQYCNTVKSGCLYPAGDFENLSRYLQQKMRLPAYLPPIIIGCSRGATLAYAVLCQAPPGTFRGAISLGFHPELPIAKPLCRRYSLQWEPSADGKRAVFRPDPALRTPWVVLQDESDAANRPEKVRKFTKATGNARYVSFPGDGRGFSVDTVWFPQFANLFQGMLSVSSEHRPPPRIADVADLPLIEIPADGAQRDLFAIVLSGDGGWAGIDKGIAAALAAEGIPTVGFNSLQYFWKPHTPEKASADLDRIINHYSLLWKKPQALVIGYSFGGDVLPFMVSRLPQATADRIALLAFLGLSSRTDFQFHLTDWIGGKSSASARPVPPEIEKLKGRPMVYLYGTEEKDNIAEVVDHQVIKVIPFDGGHHFGSNYQMLTDSILAQIR
jgi:type IV secretory pathway VirJ component